MRFTKSFRDSFASRVCRHFDKYSEITNPLTFSPLHDLYMGAYTAEQWKAMNLLAMSEFGRHCLASGKSFELYLPGAAGLKQYQRSHVSFRFDDEVPRPPLNLEYIDLPEVVKEKVSVWTRKALGLKTLRTELWMRCNSLVAENKWSPTSTCNTPGQVVRIWPELQPFMPSEYRDRVRGSSVRSKLPSGLQGKHNTVAKFQCTAYDCDPQAKRTFEALSHILIQMSLMMEVAHDKTYPSVCV